jgi:hypothetical protein
MPNNSAEVHWDKPVWKNINDAIVVQVAKVTDAQELLAQPGRAASHRRSSPNLSPRRHRGP